MRMVSSIFLLILTGGSVSTSGTQAISVPAPTVVEHVILFVLEDVDPQALKVGSMPVQVVL